MFHGKPEMTSIANLSPEKPVKKATFDIGWGSFALIEFIAAHKKISALNTKQQSILAVVLVYTQKYSGMLVLRYFN